MTTVPLKKLALNGMLWNAVDKFTVQAGHFFIGVVMARLLMPEDFGLIGMLSIFIAISQSLIDSGMGSGLIQKQNRTGIDFSTVFIFNLSVSVIIYGALYLSAPVIARFYNMPRLEILTRILSLNIIINAFSIVQRSRLTINIDFKTIAKVNVVTVILSGVIGVFFAYRGLRVWALVIQNISRATISLIMFWSLSYWRPSIRFSMQSFKDLFGFGSKLLLAGLYAELLRNVYNISIGKVYSAAKLGFYTRAKGFADLTAGSVTSVLHQVSYPILASLQDDKKKMTDVFRRLIKMTAFFVIPSMVLLALLADPFVRLILTEKWLPVVPLLQWMCFARISYPISAINMNILNAVGRSNWYLFVDLAKFPIIVVTLVITIPLGVKAIVIGHMVTSFISYFINSYLPGKHFGYGAISQIKDMVPILLSTLLMSIIVFVATSFVSLSWQKLFLGFSLGITIYLLTALFFGIKEVDEIKYLVNRMKT